MTCICSHAVSPLEILFWGGGLFWLGELGFFYLKAHLRPPTKPFSRAKGPRSWEGMVVSYSSGSLLKPGQAIGGKCGISIYLYWIILSCFSHSLSVCLCRRSEWDSRYPLPGGLGAERQSWLHTQRAQRPAAFQVSLQPAAQHRTQYSKGIIGRKSV